MVVGWGRWLFIRGEVSGDQLAVIGGVRFAHLLVGVVG